MSKPSQRPFIPCGSFRKPEGKKQKGQLTPAQAAKAIAESFNNDGQVWKPYKNGNDGYALLRMS